MDTVILDDKSAQITVRDYCCAGCWGHLLMQYIPGQGERVYCPNCGDGRGFVTKHYADRRRSEDHGDALEVKLMLESIGALPVMKRTAEEILKELY